MLDERGQSDKDRVMTHFVLLGSNSGLMKGTTPPWLIITSPKSLFSLHGHISTVLQGVVESKLTPRRCESRAVSVLVQYVASYYPGLRYQPIREFRRPNIPGQQQDRLVVHHEHGRPRTLNTVVTYQEHQRQHAVHSCPRFRRRCTRPTGNWKACLGRT